MTNPLETLRKMLALEAHDYAFQDKAVAGGLARYADTWKKQALPIFGDEDWVEDITHRLRAYSALQPEGREQAMTVLLEVLDNPPRTGVAPSVPEPPSLPSPPAAERNQQGMGLQASVTLLSGVGSKRAVLLEKLGVTTMQQLLYFYPRRYEDYSKLKTIDQLQYGEQVSVMGTVWEAGGRQTRGGRYLFQAILSDATGTLSITWFNQRYLEGRIKPGMQIVVSGKVDEYLGRLTMNSPEWEPLGRQELDTARIVPIYPSTEGLTQRWMRQVVKRALSAWAARIPDPLPSRMIREHQLLPLHRALWGIHLPDNEEHLRAARRRLAFEEALYLQIGLLLQRRHWKSRPGHSIHIAGEQLDQILETLPYTLTGAQQRSLEEILRDMEAAEPMNRLLQGDVGSGKTVVAAVAMASASATGRQAALMAPTEILAEQHFASLSKLFALFPEPRPNLRLLTGSATPAEREELYAALADGSVQLVVGTHALIQEQVVFSDLGLVVIDEQHRFGVEQRGALRQKGYNPHLLVMTATPIPRSLELTIWGHVDVSVLDEMPPGRQPIETRVLYSRERERAYAFIRHQVELGRQAFIIYPLVENSEKIEARAAVDEHERLQKEIFPDLKVGLLHGRMRSADKDATMNAFARGEVAILVATSVVEVGIDVPNATVMLIDGAERFGLAQLHQFRGRVGRGAHQSYCLLLAGATTGDSAERLKAMEETTDGFVLAEKDLEMRGPGQFLGTQQSGFPDLPLVGLADTRLLHEVRQVAENLLQVDPDLAHEEHTALARRMTEFWEEKGELS
ncbi:MAG: ATP-dependent DNA helicase RecG [Anaerolineae bacterium]|nr:ATP-dependent DNA helicase RecG [Anaerolineae bacterium]